MKILQTLIKNKRIAAGLLLTFIVAMVLLYVPGPSRLGATVVIEPNSHIGQAGQNWTAKVYVETNQPINSVDTTIHYDANLVQIGQADVDSSDFEMKVFEPSIDTNHHQVRFVQTSLQSYDDRKVLVGEITFKGVKQGYIQMTTSQTKVVADDGKGTNIYKPSLTQSLAQWLLGLVGMHI